MTRTLLIAIFLTLFSQTAWSESKPAGCDWLNSKLVTAANRYDWQENFVIQSRNKLAQSKNKEEETSALDNIEFFNNAKLEALAEMKTLSDVYKNLCR